MLRHKTRWRQKEKAKLFNNYCTIRRFQTGLNLYFVHSLPKKMSQSQSTSDLYRVNAFRGAERQKPRGNFQVEQELYELCNLSGVTLDPEVFQILLDLIQINVSPNALVQVLKKMTKQGNSRGSLENVTPSATYAHSETARSAGGSSVSSDSAFEASKGSTLKDESALESEKSSTERLANRLRALKAGRKAT